MNTSDVKLQFFLRLQENKIKACHQKLHADMTMESQRLSATLHGKVIACISAKIRVLKPVRFCSHSKALITIYETLERTCTFSKTYLYQLSKKGHNIAWLS